MKKVKFFFQNQLQTEEQLLPLEDRINEYINSLEKITLGPRPHGWLDVSFQYDPNNNSSYSDLVVMVVSEDDQEKV